MELKNKLSQLRKEKGLTQLELAELLNVSRQAVSRWEVGTAIPSLDNLVSLSRLYGVPMDYLIQDGTEKMERDLSDQTKPARPECNQKKRFSPQYAIVILCVLIIGMAIGAAVLWKYERARIPELGADGRTVIGDLANGYVIKGEWLEKTPADQADEQQWRETQNST